MMKRAAGCAMASGVAALAAQTAKTVEASHGPATPEASKHPGAATQPIDREAVVGRHDIVDANVEIPLGNGEFCFNVDATGLQSLSGSTMAHWGWHSFPLPPGFVPADVPATGTLQQGRNLAGGDLSFPPEKKPLWQWLRDNPHSANLARIRLAWADGTPLSADQVEAPRRRLDLWRGRLRCEFAIDGAPVVVETVVSMTEDRLAARVTSALVGNGRLAVYIDFPYPSIQPAAHVGDFSAVSRHRTSALAGGSDRHIRLERAADDLRYQVDVTCHAAAALKVDAERHALTLAGLPGRDTIEFTCGFEHGERRLQDAPPAFDALCGAVAESWAAFWRSGAAIDLSGSQDPRWRELERRIVLSQYLMRVNSAGSLPSAEAGLMALDCWRSQFHGEMIYWHLAHYALWNRWELAEEALGCYRRFLPVAKRLAQQLGYDGAQWPKSTGPEGRTAPWVGNQVLLWKQPHPILFAELEHRLRPTRATLEKWAEVVDQTARFMASYPEADSAGVYHLKPVMPPSELGITEDAVFDLAYWRWGLTQANVWRARLGLPAVAAWNEIAVRLAPLPTLPGAPDDERVFVHSAQWSDTYVKRNWEHPDPAGVLGMLPPIPGVDAQVARRTIARMHREWRWDRVWGWDFPWMAMGAARTGQPDIAVEMLLHSSNRNVYDGRGVNAGGNPCLYLPGNGGLLYAIGMMAGGWDGAPEVDRSLGEAPGFPRNGQWFVRCEGFVPAL